jgi:hypothetical protein
MRKESWTSKLWSIPVITICLYAVAIFTQYGYNTYFNVPGSYVEASLRANLIYSRFYLTFFGQVATAIDWITWIALFLVVLILIALYIFFTQYRILFIIFGFVLMGLFAWYSYNFGKQLAAFQSDFYTVPTSCISTAATTTLVGIVIYDNQMVFVPVETATHKLLNGFQVKNIADLPCIVGFHSFGQIVR